MPPYTKDTGLPRVMLSDEPELNARLLAALGQVKPPMFVSRDRMAFRALQAT